MVNQKQTELTPSQSADVIQYYDKAFNAEARERGRKKDKVSLGHVAVRTTSRKHSILPDKQPMLTSQEMSAGLDYIHGPDYQIPRGDMQLEYEGSLDSESTGDPDGYDEKLDKLVDKLGISYHEARQKLDSES